MERARQGMRDRGEAEAVVQASQFGADVIGRRSAISGTASCRFADRGIRLPWETVDALLVDMGERPL